MAGLPGGTAPPPHCLPFFPELGTLKRGGRQDFPPEGVPRVDSGSHMPSTYLPPGPQSAFVLGWMTGCGLGCRLWKRSPWRSVTSTEEVHRLTMNSAVNDPKTNTSVKTWKLPRIPEASPWPLRSPTGPPLPWSSLLTFVVTTYLPFL